MTRWRTAGGRPGPGGRPGNAGQAVLIAVLLVGVVMVAVAASLFLGALDNVTTSSRGVAQAQALRAAQAGVNITYQRIQSAASVATSPCGTGAVTGSLGSAPTTSAYVVSTTFYATLTAARAVTCTDLKSGTIPQVVEITSTGTDRGQTERMASEADLAVSALGAVFNDAVFAGPNFTLNGADAFNTSGKAIYVNGNARCGSGGSVSGTLIVMGTLILTGDCAIAGSVVATGKITVPSGSPSVGGKLTSTSTVTPGIKISGNPTFHTLFAKTAIVRPTWWTPAAGAKIYQNDASLTPPPAQTFPTVNWTPAGWTKAGYQAVTAGGTCAQVYQDIWAMHTAKTATGSTLPKAVYTTCKVTIPQGNPNCPTTWGTKYYCAGVVLQRNLAIVSTAGFKLPTPASFSPGTAAGTRDLFLVVPTNTKTGVPVSCKSGNGTITLTGKVKAGIDTLFFTPCTVKMSGSASVVEGQVYAATSFVPLNGMSFTVPLTLPGSSGGGSGLGGGAATVGVVNERQLTP